MQQTFLHKAVVAELAYIGAGAYICAKEDK